MMCEAIKEMRRLSREEGREENMRDMVAALRMQGIDEDAIQAAVATAEAGHALPVDPSDD